MTKKIESDIGVLMGSTNLEIWWDEMMKVKELARLWSLFHFKVCHNNCDTTGRKECLRHTVQELLRPAKRAKDPQAAGIHLLGEFSLDLMEKSDETIKAELRSDGLILKYYTIAANEIYEAAGESSDDAFNELLGSINPEKDPELSDMLAQLGSVLGKSGVKVKNIRLNVRPKSKTGSFDLDESREKAKKAGLGGSLGKKDDGFGMMSSFINEIINSLFPAWVPPTPAEVTQAAAEMVTNLVFKGKMGTAALIRKLVGVHTGTVPGIEDRRIFIVDNPEICKKIDALLLDEIEAVLLNPKKPAKPASENDGGSETKH